jgi:non-specific riboncleoside hydrolase
LKIILRKKEFKMSKRRPIIIDTDPGIDDAVAIAIALFSEELDVKLITTVAGNVSLPKVTYNALRLLKFLKKEVPVAAGCSGPLIRKLHDASNVHGASGMDGYNFEDPDDHLLMKQHAVNAMYDTIMKSDEKITLVPIAPMTNIALLLKLYPEVKDKIEEIVFMGGSATRGNMGVMSEFNVTIDPEAAKIVFDSGIPLVMAGLDVGWKALVYPEDSNKIRIMNKTGEMMYALFQNYRGGSMKTGLKMYDSCAMAYLLCPEMYSVVETYVDVELNGSMTSGCTVVDLKGYLKQPANAKVCMDINEEIFKTWFLKAIEKCI